MASRYRENTCLRPAWSKDKNWERGIELGGPLCLAGPREPNAGFFRDLRKSLFFTRPPYLLKRGGWTSWPHPKANSACTSHPGAFIKVYCWVLPGKCTTQKNLDSPEHSLRNAGLSDLSSALKRWSVCVASKQDWFSCQQGRWLIFIIPAVLDAQQRLHTQLFLRKGVARPGCHVEDEDGQGHGALASWLLLT